MLEEEGDETWAEVESLGFRVSWFRRGACGCAEPDEALKPKPLNRKSSDDHPRTGEAGGKYAKTRATYALPT